MTLETETLSKLRIARLIWTGMMASTALYGAVIVTNFGWRGRDLSVFANDPLVVALSLSAAACWGAVFGVRLYFKSKKTSTAPVATQGALAKAQLERRMLAAVLTYGLIEGGAMCGFSASFARQDPAPFLVAASISLLLFIFLRPRSRDFTPEQARS